MIKHIVQGSNDKVIILLHGTGGNERDLIPIGKYIDENATLVGIRGNVEENGMLRYFKRYPDGSFDLRSLAKETYELHKTINDLMIANEWSAEKITLLGYSNGSNIMQSMMKEFDMPYNTYYLLHPSVTLPNQKFKSLSGKVFISSGANDPYISEQGFEGIIESMKSSNIEVETYRHNQGHALTQDELSAVIKHYNQ